jgi:hypothetical protein
MYCDRANPTVLALGSLALGGPASTRSSVEHSEIPYTRPDITTGAATTDRQS